MLIVHSYFFIGLLFTFFFFDDDFCSNVDFRFWFILLYFVVVNFWHLKRLKNYFNIYYNYFSAYETLPIPIESFQGFENCSQMLGPTSPYEMNVDSGDIGAAGLIDSMPSPQQTDNNNQTAAWYDTDL